MADYDDTKTKASVNKKFEEEVNNEDGNLRQTKPLRMMTMMN